jgi:hypothetical protein
VNDVIAHLVAFGNQVGVFYLFNYTIRQIEVALVGKWKWDKWRDKIKKLYNNGTENNLDSLFDHWN